MIEQKLSVVSAFSFFLSISAVPAISVIPGLLAVYGQLAGAYYGEEGIPVDWIEKVAMLEYIIDLADRPFSFASTGSSTLDR